MLEIIHGQTRYREVAQKLGEALSRLKTEGSLYIGYPVLATADEKVTIDALLVSHNHGVVLFSFSPDVPLTDDIDRWNDLRDRQDRLYAAVESTLKRHDTLRSGRGLAVQISTVTIVPTRPSPPKDLGDSLIADLDSLESVLKGIPPLDSNYFQPLQAALQRVTTIKPRKKRETATRPNSRGAILRQIESAIANLDQWQKRAAIESPDGPQRIRGLAGSGKTIVLALKAAYLHTQHPDWVIGVTFYTRSLYQQFEDLIRRFSFEHTGDAPNWENLRIRHAWGSVNKEGIYVEIANHCGVPVRDYLYARSSYGMRDAFEGVCTEIISAISGKSLDPIYDAVLIDEAQDLPSPFLRLVYRFTRDKRIVLAYDELQKLSEVDMPSLEEIFGKDEHGHPNVYLVNSPGLPQQDIILPICYRNPPWALTVAHSLGLGTQREEGLVQHFDDPSLWTDIGYQIVGGELRQGKKIILERSSLSYPSYFKELLEPADVVTSHGFENERQQAEWLAASISDDIQEGQLEHDDILVVLPSAISAKKDARVIMEALDRRGIRSHLAGVTTSPDQIFERDSIAIANIYRSKGNEAAMVYVANSQQCISPREQITLRNTLFTAITRSRAWVRICGCGARMVELQKEVDRIVKNNYRLEFRIPTVQQLERIRQIHRELSADERTRMQRAMSELRSFIEALERGDITIENLPLELRTAVAKYFRSGGMSEDTKTYSDGNS